MAHHLLLVLVALLSLAGHGSSDLAADRAECTEKLIGLAPCLSFVRGNGKSPTPDCCTGYKQVTAKSIKCLCILVKDRNEPGLGIKVDVNTAITLPAKCEAPTNISTCVQLLNLPPDSTSAKEFQHFEAMLEGESTGNNNVKANSTEKGAVASGAIPKSDGMCKEKFMKVENFGGLWIWSLLLVLLLVIGS